MKLLILALAISAALVGCGAKEETAAPAAGGPAPEATIKGGQSKAQGMNADSLTAPAGSENVNTPGTKASGGN